MFLLLLLLFVCLFSNSLSLAENSGRLTCARHSSRKSSATHSYQSVQYFRVSKEWCLAASVRDFVTCAQMLMHATAHGGCEDIVRESALEADSGRKIPFRTGDSNPRQYRAWLLRRTLYPLSYPGPCNSTASVCRSSVHKRLTKSSVSINLAKRPTCSLHNRTRRESVFEMKHYGADTQRYNDEMQASRASLPTVYYSKSVLVLYTKII